MKRNCGIEYGFALIELLMVVCIIGIVGTLLLTGLSKAKAVAHSSTCKNHLHQMGLALQMDVDDHQGKYPFYHGFPDHAFDDPVRAYNAAFWWAKLVPYYPLQWTNPAYHCPGYIGAIEESGRRKGWTHPLGSYAYNEIGAKAGEDPITTNGLLLGLGGHLSLRQTLGATTENHSENQIAAPSEMFAIGESRWKVQDEKAGGHRGGYDFMQIGALTPNRGVFAFDPARHGKNYNQLFCDSHVAAISPWILFNQTNTAAMWNYDHLPHAEFWPAF